MFAFGDFLTKDQPAVRPKYLLLDTGLVDKLELIIDGSSTRAAPSGIWRS